MPRAFNVSLRTPKLEIVQQYALGLLVIRRSETLAFFMAKQMQAPRNGLNAYKMACFRYISYKKFRTPSSG
jgi:hypothetical protein